MDPRIPLIPLEDIPFLSLDESRPMPLPSWDQRTAIPDAESSTTILHRAPPGLPCPSPANMPLSPPPGLPQPNSSNIIPRSMNHPPDFPRPAPGVVLPPYDPRPAPKRYAIMQLHTLPNGRGTSFLLRCVEPPGLWTGITKAPRAYFDKTKDVDGCVSLREFMCGDVLMRGVSDDYFFPEYVKTWRVYLRVPRGKSPMWGYPEEILKLREFDSPRLIERDGCKRRLENEIRICEKLDRCVTKCPYLIPYKGVIVDMDKRRVQAVAYAAYKNTLLSFVKDQKLLRSEQAVTRIIMSVKLAVQHLHSVNIAHGKVVAANVFLNYSLYTEKGDEEQRAHIHAVVLGNFLHAVDCAVVSQVSEDEKLARKYSDWEEVKKLEKWLENVLQVSDRTDLDRKPHFFDG